MARRFPSLGYGLMLLLFGMGLPFSGLSQTSALLQCIRTEARVPAMQACLHQLWRTDSLQIHWVADAVRDGYERQGRPLSLPQADTLLRIYAIGQAQDAAGPHPWLLRRALLAQSQSGFYGPQALDWAIEAIAVAGDEVPAYLVLETGHRIARDFKAGKIPLLAAARAWAVLDRTLLQRQVSHGRDAAEWAQIQSQLTLELRSAMPDCNQLYGSFGDALASGKLPAADAETFLVLYDLQECDRHALWEAALGVVMKAGGNAWCHRLAGSEAFNRGQMSESRNFWQTASDLESNPVLKAHDHLQLAATFRAENDFRKARSHIQEAMRLHPSWGEPYVQLMDLYVVGSDGCTMDAFERKAMHWLLVELCQTLKAVDESYAAMADERYFEYLKACPTPEEASFQGWKPGDSYPIKCWMSTATTVPHP